MQAQTDFEIKCDEDLHSLYFFYKEADDKFCLVYDKEKDLCSILKNGKLAVLKELTPVETERYKEVLDIAINYHHDRDNEPIN